MRTTIKDIAKYLNVSTTTVSRALNDKSDISLTMRQKVLQVAIMLDYKPNSVAISLRKKSANKLIGVILPVVDHHFFSTILRGITTTGFHDDYLIMIGESNHDVTREKEILNQFNDHYVAGVIFIPSRHKSSKTNVDLLSRRNTPFILIDRTFEKFNGSYIQHDDFQGAYQATKHLISRGCTRIAMLRGDQECSVSEARHDGFKAAIGNHNLPYNQELIISCTNASKEEGIEATRSLYSRSNPPDGIFCITDYLAVGVIEYTKSKGIRIPEQLAIVGYSNSEISKSVTPKLTTVAQDGYEMGRLAKEYLIQMCLHNDVQRQMVFPSELIVRQST